MKKSYKYTLTITDRISQFQRFLLVLVFLGNTLFLSTTVAQQFPHKNLFTETSFVWNPAMTANWNFMEVGGLHSKKWTSFEDAPTTSTAYIQFPLVDQNMSIGGHVMSDKVGGLTQNRITFTYAYHLELGLFSDDQLSLGLGISLNRYLLNGALSVSNLNDPLLFSQEVGGTIPNISAGFIYRTTSMDNYDIDSHFFIGFSTYQAIPRAVPFEGEVSNFEQNIHANFIVGGRIVKENAFVEPSIWGDFSTPNQYRITLNMRYELYNTFWGGVGVSTDLTAGLQGGIILKNGLLRDGTLRVGGTMNLNTGRLSQFQGIGYDFYLAYRYEL